MNEPCPMSKDEENILRYSCGFVAKLKKRLCGETKEKVLKVPGETSSRFIECLRKMEMDGPESSIIMPRNGLLPKKCQSEGYG